MKFECGCYSNDKEIFICPKHKLDYKNNSMFYHQSNSMPLGTGPTVVESYEREFTNNWLVTGPKASREDIEAVELRTPLLAHDPRCRCYRCVKYK